EEEFRKTAGVVDGVSLVGSGSLADRLWSSYAITVTGLDVPSVSGAVNAVQAVARARVTVRVPPAGDPKTTVDAVVEFLRQVAPGGRDRGPLPPGTRRGVTGGSAQSP